jgi:hypothetical protein
MLFAHGVHTLIGPGFARLSACSLGIQQFGNLMVGVGRCQFADALEHLGIGETMPADWRTGYSVTSGDISSWAGWTAARKISLTAWSR